MNPYAILGSGIGTAEAASLCARLAAWHDAMVAHERRLRTGRTSDVCDDECPHVEARELWPEAVATFGERADELTFLRSRGMSAARPSGDPIASPEVVSEAARSTRRSSPEIPRGGSFRKSSDVPRATIVELS